MADLNSAIDTPVESAKESTSLASSYASLDTMPSPPSAQPETSIDPKDSPSVVGSSPTLTHSSDKQSSTPTVGSTTSLSPSSSDSDRPRKQHRDDDRTNWVNGKRPKGYRTPEGKEAAERCKNYKNGVSVPHLSHPCTTYEGVLKHAILGALRSGCVTYGGKALVNLCLGMLKLKSGKTSVGRIFKDAFTGQDALRFGTFFSVFSFLWKLVNNGLKLYRGADDKINGAIAGAVAGLALLIETQERRVTFAQQMFIRSMQGVYNAGKYRGQFSFRHGDAFLFALASGQVLYAYVMHPDTIPKELFSFMVKTAQVPAEALAINSARIRGFPLDVTRVKAMMERFRPTARNLEFVSKMPEYPSIIPCAVLHPWADSCKVTSIQRFIHVMRSIVPVYATLNFVPLVVLRMKQLHKNPLNVLSKTTFNTVRSSAFLAVFVSLYQTQICSHRNLLNAGWSLGDSKYLYWFFGLVSAGSSIMVEQESRRAELAMYVIPKAAASFYKILLRKNWVKGVPHWEVMMFSFAMSLIMPFYQREEQVLSPFVTRLIYHILGRN